MSYFNATFNDGENLKANFDSGSGLTANFGNSAGDTGTRDYEKLIHHPFINHEEVVGEKTGADYHLQDKMDEITAQEIDNIIFL